MPVNTHRLGPDPGEDYWVWFVREWAIPGTVFVLLVYFLWREVLRPSVELKVWRSIERTSDTDPRVTVEAVEDVPEEGAAEASPSGEGDVYLKNKHQ